MHWDVNCGFIGASRVMMYLEFLTDILFVYHFFIHYTGSSLPNNMLSIKEYCWTKWNLYFWTQSATPQKSQYLINISIGSLEQGAYFKIIIRYRLVLSWKKMTVFHYIMFLLTVFCFWLLNSYRGEKLVSKFSVLPTNPKRTVNDSIYRVWSVYDAPETQHSEETLLRRPEPHYLNKYRDGIRFVKSASVPKESRTFVS